LPIYSPTVHPQIESIVVPQHEAIRGCPEVPQRQRMANVDEMATY